MHEAAAGQGWLRNEQPCDGRHEAVVGDLGVQGLSSEDEARALYQAAAEAGQAQERPSAPEDHLTAAMQEQEQKLRVCSSYGFSFMSVQF